MSRIIAIDSINPCIRKSGIEEPLKQLGPKRFIYDYEFLYCHKGTLSIVYENTSIKCSPGEIAIIPPGMEHQLDTCLIDKAYWIHFDFINYADQKELARFIESSKSDNPHPPGNNDFIREEIIISPNLVLPRKYIVSDPMRTEELFNLIHLSFISKEAKWQLKCKTYLCEVLLETFDHLIEDSTNSISHTQLVEDITNYINNNHHRFITNEELAAQFYYHRDTLNRIFKNQMGITLGTYNQKVRHDKIRVLLQNTSLTLDNIAELTGFTDRSHLIRSFKKMQGISPKQYRNQLSHEER